MTTDEMKQLAELHGAVLDAFHAARIKPLPDTEQQILDYLQSLGVKASAPNGYLQLEQSGTQMVVAQACESIRDAHREWFVSDPSRDAIVCREDFHGSATEIISAKSAWIRKHGLEAWERLPETRALAEKRAVVPSPTMNRQDYLSLDVHSKARLAAAVGIAGIRRIMARTK